MMAHEIPLQVHPKAPSGPKTRKHKPVHQAKYLLPNGEKPDFGSGNKEKPGKGRTPQLPNGEKPDFGSIDHKKDQTNKQGGGRKARKSSGKKACETTTKLDDAVEFTKAEGKECYAGSSFHSSPEALALPKPSFAPKSSLNSSVSSSSKVLLPSGAASQNIQNLPPAFVYQGMPSNGPPRYPVKVYPPSAHPGFNYNANQQGFINYLYPPAAIPQPPLPMQSYPFQMYPPVPPPPQNQQIGGRKITFNELMGSSQ